MSSAHAIRFVICHASITNKIHCHEIPNAMQAMLLHLGACATVGRVLKLVGSLLTHDEFTVSSAASASATSCYKDMATGISPHPPVPENSTDESTAVSSNTTLKDNHVARVCVIRMHHTHESTSRSRRRA